MQNEPKIENYEKSGNIEIHEIPGIVLKEGDNFNIRINGKDIMNFNAYKYGAEYLDITIVSQGFKKKFDHYSFIVAFSQLDDETGIYRQEWTRNEKPGIILIYDEEIKEYRDADGVTFTLQSEDLGANDWIVRPLIDLM